MKIIEKRWKEMKTETANDRKACKDVVSSLCSTESWRGRREREGVGRIKVESVISILAGKHLLLQ